VGGWWCSWGGVGGGVGVGGARAGQAKATTEKKASGRKGETKVSHGEGAT